jgi:feruloyl-CoA synthase
VAEGFKLATGTWVSVGPLRAKFVAHCAPYVTDVVVAGHDRDDAAALVVPNLAACRELAEAPNGEAAPTEILACEGVRKTFLSLLKTFNAQAGGSSGRFARLILMDDPPSLDTGEMTDKGSVNQRAVLSRRAALVDELYAPHPSRRVIA